MWYVSVFKWFTHVSGLVSVVYGHLMAILTCVWGLVGLIVSRAWVAVDQTKLRGEWILN